MLRIRAQLFTSLKSDLRQDINFRGDQTLFMPLVMDLQFKEVNDFGPKYIYLEGR